MRAIVLDKRLGGRILYGKCLVIMERRGYLLRQLLAQLDTPLIIAIKAPNRALNKCDVLIQSNKLAKCMRCELLAKNLGGWTIAGKDARRDHPLRSALSADFVGSLAKGKRLCLCKEVS